MKNGAFTSIWSSEKNGSAPKNKISQKTKPSSSKDRIVYIMGLEIINYKLLWSNQTVNAELYVQQLGWLILNNSATKPNRRNFIPRKLQKIWPKIIWPKLFQRTRMGSAFSSSILSRMCTVGFSYIFLCILKLRVVYRPITAWDWGLGRLIEASKKSLNDWRKSLYYILYGNTINYSRTSYWRKIYSENIPILRRRQFARW